MGQLLFGLILDSYKVWPIAKFLSTIYVPVERHINFPASAGCCGMFFFRLSLLDYELL
jgi:hypothetical protein